MKIKELEVSRTVYSKAKTYKVIKVDEKKESLHLATIPVGTAKADIVKIEKADTVVGKKDFKQFVEFLSLTKWKANKVAKDSNAYMIDPRTIVIRENFNPRKVFDKQAHKELVASIIEFGLQQPLKIRKGKQNSLVDGERRLRAILAIIDGGIEGFDTIPVHATTEESNDLITALLSNEGKKLQPIELGLSYVRLMDELGLTKTKLEKKLNRSKKHISDLINLATQNESVIQELLAGNVTANMVRELYESAAGDNDLIEKGVKKFLNYEEDNVEEENEAEPPKKKGKEKATAKPKRKLQVGKGEPEKKPRGRKVSKAKEKAIEETKLASKNHPKGELGLHVAILKMKKDLPVLQKVTDNQEAAEKAERLEAAIDLCNAVHYILKQKMDSEEMYQYLMTETLDIFSQSEETEPEVEEPLIPEEMITTEPETVEDTDEDQDEVEETEEQEDSEDNDNEEIEDEEQGAEINLEDIEL